MTSGIGLIVPVRLEALMIGERDALNDNYFAPAYASFSVLPYVGVNKRTPYLSSVAVQRPFDGNAPLPQGIHLHWQLPYALRHGTHDRTGATTLPKAPDRWLVTRILADLANPSAPPQLRSWVIESNYLATTGTWSPYTTIPWNADPAPQTYRWLGRVYDYDEWLAAGERGTYWNELTAMGYGIPEFAALYPNCRNVFGFADTTLNDARFDAATTAIGYVVGGWYSNSESDPLSSSSAGDLGWSYSASGGESPDYSLYQGFIYGMQWRPQIAYFPGFDASIEMDVAIGNTPSEGFSALAAYKLRSEPFQNVETLLNALQLGVLPVLDDPGGTALMEQALFGDAFGGQDAATIWQIEPNKSGDEARPFDAWTRLDESLARQLDALNEAQRALDTETAKSASLRLRIFADWNKFMVIRYTNVPPAYPTSNQVFQFLNKEIAALNQMQRAIAETQSTVDSLRAAVADALPPELILTSTAAPRFYKPNDLVVVLSGEGIPLQPPDARPEARCILTSQLVSSMTLPAGLVSGSAAVTLDRASLPHAADPARLPHAALAELAPATMLADPQLAPVLASFIAAQGGSSNPALLDESATATAIAAAQDAWLAGDVPENGITFSGELPEAVIAFRKFSTPWNPIALSWRFDYTPLAGSEATIRPEFVLENFRFDGTTFDLEPVAPAYAAVTEQYSGSVLLSPDASINVQREILRYLEYVADPELEQILTALGNYPILAQSLGGFDAALLMLGNTLQLPVADPAASDQIMANFSNVTVHDAVGDENRIAPMTASRYNPLRAGRLRLSELALTDSFGRIRRIDLSQVIVAETIPVVGPNELLPPLRMTQTSRLDLRWLSAIDGRTETNLIPATHPICGWVVPNHLDSSLWFYDSGGASIGTLSASGNGQDVVWQNAPGEGAPDGTMDSALADRNAVLRDFAFSVRANGPGYIDALIRTIDRTRVFIAPANERQNLQTAVLMGAPLAIVQARASLRLLGLPSPDQSYAALREDIERGGDSLLRSVHDFTSVRFPLLLGSRHTLDDGLIGFFLANGGTVDFSRFYADAADGDDSHIVRPQSDTITLAPADPDVLITMLVDPRAGVHAFTGITPVKILTIPADSVVVALRAMTFTFLTTPILALASGLAIPRPAQIPSANWTWLTYGSEGAWAETPIAGINYEATLQTPRALLEGWMKLTETDATEGE